MTHEYVCRAVKRIASLVMSQYIILENHHVVKTYFEITRKRDTTTG